VLIPSQNLLRSHVPLEGTRFVWLDTQDGRLNSRY
jgi:hypothetical protein